MRVHLTISVLLGVMSMGYAASVCAEDTNWIPASDPRFEIRGLPFLQENEGHWWRLPQRAKENIPDYVWETSKASSGARIRFRSDTTSLAIRFTSDRTQAQNPNMSLFGEAGLDLYVDGQYLGTATPNATGEIEHVFCTGLSKQERSFCLYLPLFTETTVNAIGLDSNASIAPAEAFAVAKPVVFYGTSITHGGCASRAGLSYEAILCRQLNLDFVNFGFNGCGRGEKEVAALLAEVDASCYVLDFSQNNASPEDLEKNYRPFIEKLRSQHADTPILCVTPIYWATELPGAERPSGHEALRNVIRKAVQQCVEAGDKGVFLVEGFEVLGPKQGDGLTDGVHPNTLGFYWMANGLSPYVAKVLHLAQ